MLYEKPEVIDYGPIGDHTFDVPGGSFKGELRLRPDVRRAVLPVRLTQSDSTI